MKIVVALGSLTVLAGILLSTGNGRAAPTAAAPATLYALGDSTVSGVGATTGSYVDRIHRRLVEQGRVLRLVNLSQSGATTEDVLETQIPRLPSGPSGNGSIVMVGVGINDLVRRNPPEAFRIAYDKLLREIQRRVQAPIIVSNLPELSLVPSVTVPARPQVAARVQRYNIEVNRVALQHGAVIFDMEELSRRALPTHPDYVSADGFHPSDSGYEAWATGMWPVVTTVLDSARRSKP